MFTTYWWNMADHVQEVKAGNDIKMPITTINMEELSAANRLRYVLNVYWK